MRHVVLLNAFLFVMMTASIAVGAQEAAPPAGNPDDEKEAERMMDELRSLVVPQRKEGARGIIKKFPNTRLSRMAQQLLDEHERYDKLALAERAEEQQYRASVREYWKCRYPGAFPMPGPMRITNTTNEPLLYQVRGPEMEWSKPHTLRAGQTHVFRYPLTLRRLSKDSTIEQCLCVGVNYRFIKPTTGEPALIW